MVLYEDTRQQVHGTDKHAQKHEWWQAHGVELVRRKLDFGDYATDESNIVVDTKRNMSEICANLCGKTREHNRVRNEMERASESGYRLVFLIECTGYASIGDVAGWTHDHCKKCVHYKRKECKPRDLKSKCLKHSTRKPAQGDRLAKTMQTMSRKYGCRFEFVRPRDSARRICELLGVAYE